MAVITRQEAEARLAKARAKHYKTEARRYIFYSGLLQKYIAVVGAGGNMVDYSLHAVCPCGK